MSRHTANVTILHPRAIHLHTALDLGIILGIVAMEGLHIERVDLQIDIANVIRSSEADRGLASLPNELNALVLGDLVAAVEVVDHLPHPRRKNVEVVHRGLRVVHLKALEFEVVLGWGDATDHLFSGGSISQ